MPFLGPVVRVYWRRLQQTRKRNQSKTGILDSPRGTQFGEIALGVEAIMVAPS